MGELGLAKKQGIEEQNSAFERYIQVYGAGLTGTGG